MTCCGIEVVHQEERSVTTSNEAIARRRQPNASGHRDTMRVYANDTIQHLPAIDQNPPDLSLCALACLESDATPMKHKVDRG